jgi:hypothetical protein
MRCPETNRSTCKSPRRGDAGCTANRSRVDGDHAALPAGFQPSVRAERHFMNSTDPTKIQAAWREDNANH